MFHKYILLILVVLIGLPVFAQDDGIYQVEYNTIYSVDFPANGGQVFLQFTGTEGDIISLLAGEEEITFGAEIELDLRDSVGRSIGMKDEYVFQPFIIAELPADGVYTAVVTFTHDEPMGVEILIAKTTYISNQPITLRVGATNFATLLLIDVDDAGTYTLDYVRNSGDFSPTISALDFSKRFTGTLLRVGGEDVDGWQIITNLDDEVTYLVLISNEFSALHTSSGFDDEAEITLSLSPKP